MCLISHTILVFTLATTRCLGVALPHVSKAVDFSNLGSDVIQPPHFEILEKQSISRARSDAASLTELELLDATLSKRADRPPPLDQSDYYPSPFISGYPDQASYFRFSPPNFNQPVVCQSVRYERPKNIRPHPSYGPGEFYHSPQPPSYAPAQGYNHGGYYNPPPPPPNVFPPPRSYTQPPPPSPPPQQLQQTPPPPPSGSSSRCRDLPDPRTLADYERIYRTKNFQDPPEIASQDPPKKTTIAFQEYNQNLVIFTLAAVNWTEKQKGSFLSRLRSNIVKPDSFWYGDPVREGNSKIARRLGFIESGMEDSVLKILEGVTGKKVTYTDLDATKWMPI